MYIIGENGHSLALIIYHNWTESAGQWCKAVLQSGVWLMLMSAVVALPAFALAVVTQCQWLYASMTCESSANTGPKFKCWAIYLCTSLQQHWKAFVIFNHSTIIPVNFVLTLIKKNCSQTNIFTDFWKGSCAGLTWHLFFLTARKQWVSSAVHNLKMCRFYEAIPS